MLLWLVHVVPTRSHLGSLEPKVLPPGPSPKQLRHFLIHRAHSPSANDALAPIPSPSPALCTLFAEQGGQQAGHSNGTVRKRVSLYYHEALTVRLCLRGHLLLLLLLHGT